MNEHSSINIGGDQIRVTGTGNIGKVVNSRPDTVDRSEGAAPSNDQSRSTIFLSYSRLDDAGAADLASRLSGRGLDLWYDRAELKGGQLWRDRIRSAINTAGGMIVLFSNQSAIRSWSEQAIEVALARDVRHERLMPVIPVRLDGCEIPPMPIGPGAATLSDVHAIDLEGRFDIGVAEIVKQLRQHQSLRFEP